MYSPIQLSAPKVLKLKIYLFSKAKATVLSTPPETNIKTFLFLTYSLIWFDIWLRKSFVFQLGVNPQTFEQKLVKI